MRAKYLPLLLLVPFLAACERVGDMLELPNPEKEASQLEADGKAVGSACRHSGRSLEDCYQLNPTAQKSFVFAGWREMNDYMMQNSIEVVPSLIPQTVPPAAPPESAESPKKEDSARYEEPRARRSRASREATY